MLQNSQSVSTVLLARSLTPLTAVSLRMDEMPEGYMGSLGLHTYHDSSWGKDVQPFGGYVVMLNGGAVHWGARKIRTIPDSTAEAETAVASRASKDTVAVRMILGDLRVSVQGPTPMLGDCRATQISSLSLAALKEPNTSNAQLYLSSGYL